jgi:hypothetical protein
MLKLVLLYEIYLMSGKKKSKLSIEDLEDLT